MFGAYFVVVRFVAQTMGARTRRFALNRRFVLNPIARRRAPHCFSSNEACAARLDFQMRSYLRDDSIGGKLNCRQEKRERSHDDKEESESRFSGEFFSQNDVREGDGYQNPEFIDWDNDACGSGLKGAIVT